MFFFHKAASAMCNDKLAINVLNSEEMIKKIVKQKQYYLFSWENIKLNKNVIEKLNICEIKKSIVWHSDLNRKEN